MRRVRSRGDRWVVLTLGSALFLLPVAGSTARTAHAQGDQPGRGHLQRADPCGRLEALPDAAQADEVQCLELGTSSGVARGDFNGDGIADLAIGTPNEGVLVSRFVNGQNTSVNMAAGGTVTVIYGTAANGLATGGGAPAPQLIHQEVAAGVDGDVQANDRFGAALASGDFNDDGFSDLAVSVPGDNAVQIFPGTSTGLDLVNDQLILGTNFVDNQGFALTLTPGLTWGDFNGDGFGDLAITATEPESIGVRANVVVLYGSQQFGLQFVGLDVFAFGNAGAGGENQFAQVAMTLAAGDFSNDGAHDLAVGLPLADVVSGGQTLIDAGTVTILQGLPGTVTTGGLGTAGATGLTESNANFIPNHNEQFGTALGVGDFDGDGAADLAIGTPREAVVGTSGTLVSEGGFVAVFSRAQTLHGVYTQLPLGLSPQAFERFGSALTAADFNGDGARDLAIGTPGDVINGISGAGSVVVLYGIPGVGLPRPASAGLPQINGTMQVFHQDTAGVPDVAEAGDRFGATLTAWNFGRSAHADLVVGVPDEDIVVTVNSSLKGVTTQTRSDAGALHVLYGTATLLQTTGTQFWTQNSAGVPDSVEAGDRFGSALY